jgi:general secretion pathway protein G
MNARVNEFGRIARVLKLSLAVLAGVVLLLLATAAFLVDGANTRGRTVLTTLDVEIFRQASVNYFQMLGSWPKSIHSLVENPSNIFFVSASVKTNDPWGRPIIYEPFDQTRGYGRVLSYGRDGKPGGEGPDADIERRFGP